MIVGADVSSLTQVRTAGAVFRDSVGVADALVLMQRAGLGMLRLRLWHTPDGPWCGLDSTIVAAKRARDAGLPWMLDLHYSDTWADPGKQTKPAAWRALHGPALQDSVYAYTRAVLRACVASGVTPRAVQLGNEIAPGMLWDDGRVGWPGSRWDTPEQWAMLTSLLRAAARAVADEVPGRERPEVILHVANGGDARTARWFFDSVIAAHVPFDAIGVSYYPWWHGSLEGLRTNLEALASRYGKRIWIVETSYPWTLEGGDAVGNFVTGADAQKLLPGYPATPEGQMAFLMAVRDVIQGLPNGLGAGVLVWEPAMVPVPGGPDNPSENLTLFDFAGRALPGLGFARARRP